MFSHTTAMPYTRVYRFETNKNDAIYFCDKYQGRMMIINNAGDKRYVVIL